MSTLETSEIRELTSDEVDAVNGGLVVIAIIGVLVGLLLPAVQTSYRE
jgi:lactobin A/cerein 7B family class IIb bacteriocin